MINKGFIADKKHLTIIEIFEGQVLFIGISKEKFCHRIVVLKNFS